MTKHIKTLYVLEELLDAARKRGPLTKEERDAQRISWVAGELGIQNPMLTPEECRRRAEKAFRDYAG
jgi:hypothetical protein